MPLNKVYWPDYLTIKDLCVVFDRTPMTISSWRKRLGLPHVLIKGNKNHSVRFVREDVYAWAIEHDKEIVKKL